MPVPTYNHSCFKNIINLLTFDVCLFQETWWAFFLLSLPVVELFYVPGVAPRNFHDGDVVDIKVQLEE